VVQSKTMKRWLLVVAIAVGTLPTQVQVAQAACAADPDALTFRQMIQQGQTGSDYDVMILGKAIRIRDVGGGRGGRTIAKLAVAETPAGSAPLISRIYFYRPPPGSVISENFEFHRGKWYVVIAAHRARGGFAFDGACGQTQSVSRERFHRLVRLAEHA
jgi:hypothetical protein